MATYTPAPEEKSKRPDAQAAGKYRLCVIDAEETTSEGGNEMIKLKLEVIGPDIAEEEGAILYDYLVFTPNAFWKIDQYRSALGEEVIEGAPVEVVAENQVGRTLEANLIVSAFKGRKSNKIGEYITASAPF